MKKTDIGQIRELAVTFMNIDVTFNEKYPFVVKHPFFDTAAVITPDGKLIDIHDKENLKKVREKYIEIIKQSSFHQIITMICSPYRFTFLKYAKPYLSKEDFDKTLAECWITSENPNQDSNVQIRTFISWFKKADKKTIMNEEEYEYYRRLPDIVDVYRGVAVGRAEQKGLSWTCKYETAEWFSRRFDNEVEGKYGYILKGRINKEDVFAYFNSRGEDEVLCNSSKVYDIERIERNAT